MTRTGSFNYLARSVESSLYTNGRVFTMRDRDGSDGGTDGVVIEAHQQGVGDARRLLGEACHTLDRSGFELLRSPLRVPDLDFFEVRPVVGRYYDECAAIVKDATKAAVVYAFDHNVRSARGKKSRQRLAGGQEVQSPARVVHGDYTLASAPQRLRDLSERPSQNDTYRTRLEDEETLLSSDQVERVLGGGRFALINLWRSIGAAPVAQDPIALCDARCVRPEDLVVFEIRYDDRVGENYFAKHSDRHRWYFYPEMTRDEALLIKQWDSAGALAQSAGAAAEGTDALSPCTFSFHSAFHDASAPEDAPARWSIEVRCVALFE